MSIWDDIKKGLKGSDEYRAGKAKKKASKKAKTIAKASKKRDEAKKSNKIGKQKRAQNKINKASGSKVKHTKASIKKANKADESWSKASKSAKASGTSISSLVKKRKGLKKGTAEYAKVQNQINKHYGSKVKHKAPKKSSGVGRLDRDKVAGKFEEKRPVKITAKTDARPKAKPTVHKTMTADKGDTSTSAKNISKNEYAYKSKKNREEIQKERDYKKRRDEGFQMGTQKKEDGGMVNDMRPQYEHGGKVEGGGLFSFPSKDARKR